MNSIFAIDSLHRFFNRELAQNLLSSIQHKISLIKDSNGFTKRMAYRTFLFKLGLGIAVSAMAFCAHATPQWQPHAEIYQQVESFALQHSAQEGIEHQIKVYKLDSRLKIPHCQTPFHLNFHDQAKQYGKRSVKVTCNQTKPWSIYVSINIDAYRQVIVVKTPVKRGNVVSAADIETKRVNLAKLRHGYYVNTDEVIGLVAKRQLRRNYVLSPKHLEEPLLVKNGDKVSLSSSSGPITISASGIAMGNGRMGDRIRVKNASSGRMIFAEVVGDRRLHVQN